MNTNGLLFISADPRQQQGERVRGPRPGIHVAEATSSVLHCHGVLGVLALRDRSLSEALLAVLEGVRLVSRQFRKRRLALWAAGRRARFALHCHGVLALRDRSLSEALLAVLEGVRLVS